jgi:glycosyltransferase involved in cell wall biosynthesis
MISVIIASRDRSALLQETLDAISAQDPPGLPVEVIVVDNGSVDDTPDVVASASRRMPFDVKYLYEGRPGKSHALNTAVTHARGEIMVFTDDDVLPSPGWLAAFVRALDETQADFATGRILPRWEATPPRWLSPQMYGALSVADGGTERLRLAKDVNTQVTPMGGNLAVRRRVVERIGGWNPDLGSLKGTLRTGEDHEFALEMFDAGFVGVYEPDACVSHRVPAERMRVGYFVRWLTTNGAIHATLEERYPTTSHYLLSVPRYLWRLIARDFADGVIGVVSLNARRALAGYMRMLWFAAYLRGRWQLRAQRPGAAAVPQ